MALNRPATADSQQYGTYAAKANDGDFTTTWFTGKPTPDNWWKVDLGKAYNLTGCRLMWHDPGFWYQYKIEASADDSRWTNVVDMTRNTEATWVPVHAFTAKDVRYLRVTVTGMEDGCWLGIRDVEVFDTLPLPVVETTPKSLVPATRAGEPNEVRRGSPDPAARLDRWSRRTAEMARSGNRPQ